LYNYKARYYSPTLGRFLSADSLTPGGPEGLNRYSYANNSPINFNDPSGHCVQNDRACLGTLAQIQGNFRVTIDDSTRLWTLDALHAIQAGMQALMDKMGKGHFLEEFSGVSFTIDDCGDHYLCTWGNKDIVVPPEFLDPQDTTYVTHETVHEFSHIWDDNCDDCMSKGLLDVTGGKYYEGVHTFIGKIIPATYKPGGHPPTSYAMSNPREDWAESVTAVVFPGYATLPGFDQSRQNYVNNSFKRPSPDFFRKSR
jgi:hypothetical protein